MARRRIHVPEDYIDESWRPRQEYRDHRGEDYVPLPAGGGAPDQDEDWLWAVAAGLANLSRSGAWVVV